MLARNPDDCRASAGEAHEGLEPRLELPDFLLLVHGKLAPPLMAGAESHAMKYWLDLFTGTTWREFLDAGASVSGFRAARKGAVSRIQRGDVLLCYLTGVMRWVGALEVLGPSENASRIWKDAEFPARVAVRPLVKLSPEHGVPMKDLEGKVEFYRNQSMWGKFNGFLRGSPTAFKRDSDGELILKLLREAEAHPVPRPVDAKKLARRPPSFSVKQKKGSREVITRVTVPESEEPTTKAALDERASDGTRHSEIQYHLLSIGADMGLDVWVARNDRGRLWNGLKLGEHPRMLDVLPTQFNDATNRTIELIDVLWLKGNSIVAAFEVECTTSIYSGLLRMSDLLALQPNLNIRLYLVAPDDRRERVAQEIRRPTFSLRDRPLPEMCGFLPFSKLVKTIDSIREMKLAGSLNADFLKQVAEYFEPTEE